MVICWCLSASTLQARPEGIIGYSGKHGDSCSDSSNCHAGGPGPLPIVELSGPLRTGADAIVTFHFSVHSQASRQVFAGFNVAASDGELIEVAGENERLEEGELTQRFPQGDSDGVATWTFAWRAPSVDGSYTLFAAGLSANGNGGRNGDDSAVTELEIAVVDSFGDANCDAAVTAADVTAVVLRFPDAMAGVCAEADLDGNARVDAADVAALPPQLFTR